MLAVSCLCGCLTLKYGAPALLDLCRSQVFLVRGHRPLMAEGVDELGVAVAPKHIHQRRDGLGAGCPCLIVQLVDILDVNVNRHRRVSQCLGGLGSHVGELLVQEQG